MFFEYQGSFFNPQYAVKVGGIGAMGHGSFMFTVVFVDIGKQNFVYPSHAEAEAALRRFVNGKS
ncbi:hypothetical protein [Stenotrophomonas maltophilia]|uniref:hypothetical protein n=1 Tax=Stenotrophomonas maltophilia TaxID=40324 RepID=UPI000A6D9948|nr:hypothetical protein [Stenotrophomonas maltophilia]ELK2666179.1 hypothetical protein [Stenotrophomonas maltophilia]MBH1377753.1 hypothetical protein [Stenotrophomonas maltophilia]MBH1440441.1 hypothetical protein [Stenotrophomonas maltophilia]MBH1559059.1 hypothetical protein [Stenotrophomonas maltophilia]MBN4987257.1 hypothetical protein [Stenotrophomonas maltophilia]